MIKEVIKKLPKKSINTLIAAFEAGVTYYVRVNSNYFIGVYIKPSRKFQVIETLNNWSYGRLHR